MTYDPPMSHQHWVKGGPFVIDCQLRMPGEGTFLVPYAYGKTKVGSRRKTFRETHNRVCPRGEWVTLLRGLRTGTRRSDTDMLLQWRLRNPPADAPYVEARFVRRYPGGRLDGTGDAVFMLPAAHDWSVTELGRLTTLVLRLADRVDQHDGGVDGAA